MNLVAVVLAGGRSSRLGGVPKSGLIVAGRTLLQRTLDAVADARQVVVVGDVLLPEVSPRPGGTGTPRLLVTRESPPFAGPAAAIAAGVDALSAAGDVSGDLVLVLACDMPDVAAAIGPLLEAAAVQLGVGEGTVSPALAREAGARVTAVRLEEAETGRRDGIVAVDADGRRQVLAGVYRGAALAEAIARARADGPIAGLSVRKLLGGLDLVELRVPESSTADIDTWSDAEAFGIAPERPDTDADADPDPDPGAGTGPVTDAHTEFTSAQHALTQHVPIRGADSMTSTTPGSAAEPRDQGELLRQWVADLSRELLAGGASGSAVPELERHLDAILALAGTAAHAVVRPAAPLTTFVAGYAAGLAAAGGEPVGEAVARATTMANEFALNWQGASGSDASGSSVGGERSQ